MLDKPTSEVDENQIDLDINRTLRNHIMYRQRYGPGQQRLFNVLRAYANYNPEVGFCQGMASVAAFLSFLFFYHLIVCLVHSKEICELIAVNMLKPDGKNLVTAVYNGLSVYIELIQRSVQYVPVTARGKFFSLTSAGAVVQGSQRRAGWWPGPVRNDCRHYPAVAEPAGAIGAALHTGLCFSRMFVRCMNACSLVGFFFFLFFFSSTAW